MNTFPMIFLFSSGSSTPASASINSSEASTNLKFNLSLKVLVTCSTSPSLKRPWSTNTAVKLSPIASWTRTEHTELSTPPDNAIIAFSLPICSLIFWIDSSINSFGLNIIIPHFPLLRNFQ